MASAGHGSGHKSPKQSPHSQPTGSPSHSQQDASKVDEGGGDQNTQLLSRARLQALMREVNPTAQLDKEVEDILLQLADDFVDTTLNGACSLAKHRNASTLEPRDVQLYLERVERGAPWIRKS